MLPGAAGEVGMVESSCKQYKLPAITNEIFAKASEVSTFLDATGEVFTKEGETIPSLRGEAACDRKDLWET